MEIEASLDEYRRSLKLPPFWPVYKPLIYSILAYLLANGAWASTMILTGTCDLWMQTMFVPHIPCAIILTAMAAWRGKARGHADVAGSIIWVWATVALVLSAHASLFGYACVP